MNYEVHFVVCRLHEITESFDCVIVLNAHLFKIHLNFILALIQNKQTKKNHLQIT